MGEWLYGNFWKTFELLNFDEPQFPRMRVKVMAVGSEARLLESSPVSVSDQSSALEPGYSLLSALVSPSVKWGHRNLPPRIARLK